MNRIIQNEGIIRGGLNKPPRRKQRGFIKGIIPSLTPQAVGK